MKNSEIVRSDRFRGLLRALSIEITFCPDLCALKRYLAPRAIVGKRGYDEDDHIMLIVIEKTDFFATTGGGFHIGIYQHLDGKEYILKVDGDGGAVIGDSVSNWVDSIYTNPASYDNAGFKSKCLESFGVPVSDWDEEWPDLSENLTS